MQEFWEVAWYGQKEEPAVAGAEQEKREWFAVVAGGRHIEQESGSKAQTEGIQGEIITAFQ